MTRWADCVTSARRLLAAPTVNAGIADAWLASLPGATGCHEEGGFIMATASGEVEVVRWSKGERDMIVVPDHVGCIYGGKNILGTFHTHPNSGAEYIQGPSDADVYGVQEDPNLKGAGYVGEFVVSSDGVYLIPPAGDVVLLGETRHVLTLMA